MDFTTERGGGFVQTRYAGHRAVIIETRIEGCTDVLTIDAEHESQLVKASIPSSRDEILISLTDTFISPETWDKVKQAVDDLLSLWEEYKRAV